MNALSIGIYTHTLLQQVHVPSIRCWGLPESAREAFSHFMTFDVTEPFEPSLEDFPGAIGFIFRKPVYILDETFPVGVRMTVHLPGQIGYIDQRERTSWIWSN